MSAVKTAPSDVDRAHSWLLSFSDDNAVLISSLALARNLAGLLTEVRAEERLQASAATHPADVGAMQATIDTLRTHMNAALACVEALDVGDARSGPNKSEAPVVRVWDMSDEGTGPWRLMINGVGCADWPWDGTEHDAQSYAEEVARCVAMALASARCAPAAKATGIEAITYGPAGEPRPSDASQNCGSCGGGGVLCGTTCPSCSGSGRRRESPKPDACDVCKGSRKVMHEGDRYDCPECMGTGTVDPAWAARVAARKAGVTPEMELSALRTVAIEQLAEIGRLKSALGEIAALGDFCEDCEPSDATVATHLTTSVVTGIPEFLCEEHAEEARAAHRKAESKGCGKQPGVVEHEQDLAVTIALAALSVSTDSKEEA